MLSVRNNSIIQDHLNQQRPLHQERGSILIDMEKRHFRDMKNLKIIINIERPPYWDLSISKETQSQEPPNIPRGIRNLLTLIMIEFHLFNHMLILHKILTNFNMGDYCLVMICHPLWPWWGSLWGTMLTHLFCLLHTISGSSIEMIHIIPTQIPPTTLKWEISVTCQSPWMLTVCCIHFLRVQKPMDMGTIDFELLYILMSWQRNRDERPSGQLHPIIWWKKSWAYNSQ